MTETVSLAILGLVQGLTEFLPVSSSGHLILARDVFGLTTEYGLAIDAVLQLATACAVVVYFWRDLMNLLLKRQWQLVGALAIGTVPAVVFGLLLESYMETTFRSSTLVAYALILGSLIMLLAEYLSRQREILVGWRQGLVVGLFQCLALVPGMSRSGMTIAGGMFLGLSRSDAARFGFLLSIPILFGTGLKKLFDLEAGGVLTTLGMPLAVGSATAFFSGLVAIYLVMTIVRRAPLTWFVGYRLVVAALILVLV